MNKKTAFSNMSHGTYVQELVGRNMDKDIGNITDMKKKLIEKLSGTYMLSALIYGSSSVNLRDLGLEKYGILPLEPCHDIAGHIKKCIDGATFPCIRRA